VAGLEDSTVLSVLSIRQDGRPLRPTVQYKCTGDDARNARPP
jgi:hypothetical protein